MNDLVVTPAIVIPAAELAEKFIRASGPGGQNVNKVASAVQLSFDVRASQALPPLVQDRILASRDHRLTQDGVLVIVARRFREQERNRLDARERLAEIVREAARPRKSRRATRPPMSSKRKRLDSKKHRASLKQGRGRPAPER